MATANATAEIIVTARPLQEHTTRMTQRQAFRCTVLPQAPKLGPIEELRSGALSASGEEVAPRQNSLS